TTTMRPARSSSSSSSMECRPAPALLPASENTLDMGDPASASLRNGSSIPVWIHPGRIVGAAGAGRSITEPVAHLREDLPGIVIVKSAESQAVVEQQAAVRDVQRAERGGQV